MRARVVRVGATKRSAAGWTGGGLVRSWSWREMTIFSPTY
jgi:hypothetical protein